MEENRKHQFRIYTNRLLTTDLSDSPLTKKRPYLCGKGVFFELFT